MNDLEFYEGERKKVYRKYRIFVNIGLFLITIAAILVIILVSRETLFLIPLVFPLFMGGFAFIALGAYKKNKFAKTIKREIVKNFVDTKFEEVKLYEPQYGLSESDVLRSGITSRPDRFSSEDLIEGVYKEIKFRVSDCHMEDEHTDSEGHTSTTTVFKGRYYIYEFKRKFVGTLKVWEKLIFGNKQNLKKIETESIRFNKTFRSWTDDQQFAFYMLTPSVIEKLLAFEEKYKGKMAFYVHENELHIAVDDNNDYMEINIKNQIDEKMYGGIIRDVELIFDFVDFFELDSDKFNQ